MRSAPDGSTLIWDVQRDIGGPPIDSEMKKIVRQAGPSSAVGIEIVLAFLVGYFLGPWLDKKLGTPPWRTWIVGLSCAGAAILALVHVTRRYLRMVNADEAGAENQSSKEPTKKPDPDDGPPPQVN